MKKTICFLGTDGAGKSTLIKKTSNYFQLQNKKVKSVYFGWEPFLPTTKFLSKFLQKKNVQTTNQLNKKSKSKFRIPMLSYFYIEYLARYVFQVKFSKANIIILDRYFYDLFAHYDFAISNKFANFLLKIYPKPTHLFFLDIPPEVAKERKPEVNVDLLRIHRSRYLHLSNKIKFNTINTNKPIEECIREISNITN